MLLHDRDGLTVRGHLQFGLNAVVEDNLFWDLAATTAPGSGFDPDTEWLEGYVKPGLSFEKTLDTGAVLYGKLSAVASYTWGTDAFDTGDTGATTLEEAYLAIRGTPSDVFEEISKLELPGAALDRALDLFARRFVLLSELGVDTSQFTFSAEFGYNLEYYTGHVFQIETQGHDGPVQLVGGGRYDRLMSDLGADEAIPAVGFAVHTERLAAITGEISND